MRARRCVILDARNAFCARAYCALRIACACGLAFCVCFAAILPFHAALRTQLCFAHTYTYRILRRRLIYFKTFFHLFLLFTAVMHITAFIWVR